MSEAARVVLVTGGARRIGRAIASRLAQAGWSVLIHHRASADEAAELVRELREQACRAEAVQADLEQTAGLEAFLEDAKARFGGLHAIVHNASAFEYDRPGTFDASLCEALLRVNLLAPLELSRAFAQGLEGEGSGAIVHLLDQKLSNPNPDFFSYTLSKAALAEAVRLQAMDLAPQIRVNAVAPGLTLPSADQRPEQFEQVHCQTPLGRGSRPEDIAEAVRFLLEAEVITGQTLLVDGGQHLAASERDVMFKNA